MLAQNFKTPTDLGITDAEFDALAKVLRSLERGEFVYTDDMETYKGPNGFSMFDYDAAEYNNCGTVCCIAGWSDRLFETDFSDRHHCSLTPALTDLFDGPEQCRGTTPAQAAIALRNFLTHGEPRWDEALSDQG